VLAGSGVEGHVTRSSEVKPKILQFADEAVTVSRWSRIAARLGQGLQLEIELGLGIDDQASELCPQQWLARDGAMRTGAPGVKQQLAAMRMLFDWLITGQIVPTNSAAVVRGPKRAFKTGKDAGARGRRKA